MHRLLSHSRSGLVGVLLIVAALAAACANMPTVGPGESPVTGVPTSEAIGGGTATPPPPVPGTPAAGSPVPGSVAVIDQARAALAQSLGVQVADITVVSSGQVDWPNGCLGIQKPGIMCTDVIVPGYQVILEANGKQYEMRTDLSGQTVVLAPDGAGEAALPEAAVRVRERAAVDLGVELGLVKVIGAEQVDWPDACLGAPDPAELCAQMVTPGYRVTVETNGQQYIYHTDQTGQNIRRENQPPAAGEFPAAAQAARQALATELGIPLESINVQRADATEFTDSCLGLGGPAESCLQAITPGYKVFLEWNGEQYVYHTDQDGTNVRPETPVAAATPGSTTSGQTTGAVIGLRADASGACTDVRIDLQGVSFGACGSEMVATGFLTNTNRLEQLQDMQRVYASFGASTPAGKVTFVGNGPVEATPIEQRMIAEWANLVALETRGGTRVAMYGMEWHREGGIAGFCDEIAIDAGGMATWTSCKQGAADAQPAASWRRLTSEELTQFYGWIDTLGAVVTEQKDPAVADAMTIRATLAGRGNADPAQGDKNGMLQFGSELMQQWAEATPARFISTLGEVNIRKGPSEQFDVIDKIAAGQQALVTGVSRDSQWWRVVCPDGAVGNCWVANDPSLTQPIAPAGSTGIQPQGEGQPAIDETQILAAVIRRVYTVDDTFGGNSKLPLVYLLAVNDTDGSAIPYASTARQLAAPVQQGVVAALSDLNAQFKWVATAGEVKRDKNNSVEGGAAIITVGQVRPQPDGTVRVTCSIYLGPLAAGGQTYVLENQGGEWQITGTTGAQWIS